MKRLLTIACLLTGLLVGCMKQSESEVPEKDEPAGKSKTARSIVPSSPGDRGSGGRAASGGDAATVPNAYADEHWDDADAVSSVWTEEFKVARTPEERITVMERKQGSGPEQLAPLIRLSLRDPEERVRTEAAKMLVSFGSNPVEAVDLVVGATHDPSSEVRILAMEAATGLPAEVQLEIYGKTIAVPHDEVRKMTITELGRMMSKPAFDVLLTGLQDPRPEFRSAVNSEISLIVQRTFGSFDDAKNWWDGNIQRYADNMIEISGSQ